MNPLVPSRDVPLALPQVRSVMLAFATRHPNGSDDCSPGSHRQSLHPYSSSIPAHIQALRKSLSLSSDLGGELLSACRGRVSPMCSPRAVAADPCHREDDRLLRRAASAAGAGDGSLPLSRSTNARECDALTAG